MKLQVKDSGAWRNVVVFDPGQQAGVEVATAALLQAASSAKTVFRIADGEKVLRYCEMPACVWRSA